MGHATIFPIDLNRALSRDQAINHHMEKELLRTLGRVDIHLVQMNALTRQRMDKNALGVWS